MKPQRVKRLRRAGIAAALAAVLAFGVPSSSWAYWSASATPPNPDVSAATVPVPGSFTCTTAGGILGQTANFSWNALPALSGGEVWKYQVWVRAEESSATVVDPDGQVSTTIPINQGLLSGLVGGLLDLLLGGTPTYIHVIAVHPTGWTSDATAEIRIAGGGLAGLIGVKCA